LGTFERNSLLYLYEKTGKYRKNYLVGNWQRNTLAERNSSVDTNEMLRSSAATHCKVARNLRANSDQKRMMVEKNYTYARKLVAREN